MAPGDMTGCRGWVQFSLTGPNVNLSTTLDVGCDSNLLLPPATFKPNRSLLASGSVLANLNGGVSSKGLVSLLNRGHAVKTLPAGKYRVTILDKDTKGGFSILGPQSTKVSTLTGPGYVGRKTVTLNLTAGRWVFYSNVGKQSAFLVTSSG